MDKSRTTDSTRERVIFLADRMEWLRGSISDDSRERQRLSDRLDVLDERVKRHRAELKAVEDRLRGVLDA